MLNATPHAFVGSTTFTAAGMTCSGCVLAVVREITRIDGVDTATVDLASGSVTVTTTVPVDRSEIAAVVDQAGYILVP